MENEGKAHPGFGLEKIRENNKIIPFFYKKDDLAWSRLLYLAAPLTG